MNDCLYIKYIVPMSFFDAMGTPLLVKEGKVT